MAPPRDWKGNGATRHDTRRRIGSDELLPGRTEPVFLLRHFRLVAARHCRRYVYCHQIDAKSRLTLFTEQMGMEMTSSTNADDTVATVASLNRMLLMLAMFTTEAPGVNLGCFSASSASLLVLSGDI